MIMFFPQKVVSPRVSLVCAEEGDGFLNDIMQGCLQIFFVHSVFKNLKSIKMKMKVGLSGSKFRDQDQGWMENENQR